MLCYAMLCYTMLCYAMLCYIMPCLALLYCLVLNIQKIVSRLKVNKKILKMKIARLSCQMLLFNLETCVTILM